MATFTLGALAALISEARADWQANLPLPSSPPMALSDAAAIIPVIQPDVEALNAWIVAHPGAITAAGRVLTAVADGGPAWLKPWAAKAQAVLTAAPGALAMAANDLPTVAGLLAEFAPAPIGIPGSFSGGRGHI